MIESQGKTITISEFLPPPKTAFEEWIASRERRGDIILSPSVFKDCWQTAFEAGRLEPRVEPAKES